MDKQKLYDIVTKILERGNNVEIKKASDGSIVVMEVKRNKVTR